MTVCQFVITSATGQRRRLPQKQIVDATWAEVRYGGFADWSINTSAGFTELATIAPTDVLDIYLDGEAAPVFRGRVNSRRRQRGAPSNLTLSGYGRFLQAGSHVCQKRYSYYGGADISRAFSDVANDAILPKEPGLTLAPALVGQTTDSLDAYNQRTQDVFNNLTKLTGGGAVWGVDVNTDPNDAHYLSDELYIRPISTVADFGLPASARRITSGETEERTDQLLNVAVFVGGPPMYPNLLYNSNWVRPVFSGNGVGNLLQSPGFEDQQNWSLGAGAAYKVTGKQEGGTYAGNWMIEIDHPSEYFEQTRNNCGLVAGDTLVFAGHTRREHGDDHCTAKMELFWRDAGNNESLGSAVLDGTVINPVGDAWVYYNQPAQIPAGATGFRLRVTLLTIGTDDANPGHTPGMVWDEMEVFDANIVRQDGWALNPNGDAEVLAQNWQVEGGNGADGDSTAYAVYAKVHASDQDGHDIHLARPGPGNSPAFTAVANGQYAYGRFLKRAPGVAASPLMCLQTETFDGSGKRLGGYNRQTIPANALTDQWQWFEVNCSLGPDASQANAELVFRGDGECLIGAGAFRDIGAVEADPVAFCIPDGNLQLTLRAADIMPLGSPEQQSASVYGEWADIVTESSITTRADAITYMMAVFKARATPPVSPVLEVIYDGKKFRCGLNVKLIGQDASVLFPLPMLPIVKVTWRWDGQLHATLELSNPKPDIGDNILAKIAKANALGVLATANAATSNSAGTSGGGVGITQGQAYFGPLAHTADDPTLHDAFRTGPHLSDQEHTDLAQTKAEVVAARTDQFGNAFLNLKARADSIPVGVDVSDQYGGNYYASQRVLEFNAPDWDIEADDDQSLMINVPAAPRGTVEGQMPYWDTASGAMKYSALNFISDNNGGVASIGSVSLGGPAGQYSTINGTYSNGIGANILLLYNDNNVYMGAYTDHTNNKNGENLIIRFGRGNSNSNGESAIVVNGPASTWTDTLAHTVGSIQGLHKAADGTSGASASVLNTSLVFKNGLYVSGGVPAIPQGNAQGQVPHWDVIAGTYLYDSTLVNAGGTLKTTQPLQVATGIPAFGLPAGNGVSLYGGEGYGLDYLSLTANSNNTGIAVVCQPNGVPGSLAYDFQFGTGTGANLLFLGANDTKKHILAAYGSGAAGSGYPLVFRCGDATWGALPDAMTLDVDGTLSATYRAADKTLGASASVLNTTLLYKNGLYVSGGVPLATAGAVGLVKPGANLTVAADGTLNALKREWSTQIPLGATASSSPDTSLIVKVPYGPNQAVIQWRVDLVTIETEQPNANPTTVNVAVSNGGNTAFASVGNLLTTAVSISGTGAYSAVAPANTMASIVIPSGSKLALIPSAIGSASAYVTVQLREQ